MSNCKKVLEVIHKLEPHPDLYVHVIKHQEPCEDPLPHPGFALPRYQDGTGFWLALTSKPSSWKRPKKASDLIEWLRPYSDRSFGYCQIVDWGNEPDDPQDTEGSIVLDISAGIVHGLFVYADPNKKQPRFVEAHELIPQLEPYPEYTVISGRLRKPVSTSSPVIVLLDDEDAVDALVLTNADIIATPQVRAKELLNVFRQHPESRVILTTMQNPVRWEAQEDFQLWIALHDRGETTDILVLTGVDPSTTKVLAPLGRLRGLAS